MCACMTWPVAIGECPLRGHATSSRSPEKRWLLRLHLGTKELLQGLCCELEKVWLDKYRWACDRHWQTADNSTTIFLEEIKRNHELHCRMTGAPWHRLAQTVQETSVMMCRPCPAHCSLYSHQGLAKHHSVLTYSWCKSVQSMITNKQDL